MRYRNLTPPKYATALLAFGIPTELADLIADSEAGAETGALFDDGRELSTLIGRPTTPLATSIALALAGAKASEAGDLAAAGASGA